MDNIAKRIGRFDEIIMLGAVARDPNGVRLLKRVRANQMRRDLPRDHHHRD